MDLGKEKTLNCFSKFVDQGMGINFGLESRHLRRGVVVHQRSEVIFCISIERHPNLFGRGSLGKLSSAFATVIQTFLVNIQTENVKFEGEFVKDLEIDYYALADEDFNDEAGNWWLDNDNRLKLRNIISKNDVIIFAKEIFLSLDLRKTNNFIYSSNYKLPSDFMDNLIEAQEEIFIDKLLTEWEFLRMSEYDD